MAYLSHCCAALRSSRRHERTRRRSLENNCACAPPHDLAMNQSHAVLLGITLVAIIGLIVLVARFKVHAFVALILASLFVGLCSKEPLLKVADAFQQGVGNTLAIVAVVVGLGTMLGKLLAESGGAEVVATRFIQVFGPNRLPWALLL